MKLLCAAAATLLAVPLLAQQPPGTTPLPGTAPPAKAEAEVVDRPETPQEKQQRLLDQVRKLEEELTFLRGIESAGGLLGNVKHRLRERTLTPTAIEDPGAAAKAAGTDAATTDVAPAPAPTPPIPQKARLLGDDEKKTLPEGTILTVDGMPVSEADYQQIFTYLRSVPTGVGEEEAKTQAIEVLIRRKAAEAAFRQGAAQARDRMVQAQQQLKGGADFAEVAKEMSDCPSKTTGGDLGFFGRSGFDTHFTAAAFTLKDGEVSGPVQTSFGYHLIKRTGFKKGNDPSADQVRCSHILAMYAGDQFAVREVQNKVSSGAVDVAFVSDDYRKLAPATMR